MKKNGQRTNNDVTNCQDNGIKPNRHALIEKPH